MQVCYSNELQHFGIKGQKWGVRRFQKKDGSLTSAGRKRYDDDVVGEKKTSVKAKTRNEQSNAEQSKKGLTDKQKTVLKVGVVAAGTVLATYGAYKVSEVVRYNNKMKAAAAADRALEQLNKQYRSQSESYNRLLKEMMSNSEHGVLEMYGNKTVW